ncbi:MAG: stage II sporulation protein M [Clostridia bacterium]|nr:stage II sporulation protein M [Clostridia bacterium]
MVKLTKKSFVLPDIVLNHVKSNIKEYIIVLLVFIVGIFLGVLCLNNTKDEQKEEISTYICSYINQAKENKNISTVTTLKNCIKENIFLAFGLWFAGTTLIGIPIVFGIIVFRGFCLGYTISACTYAMGVSKGLAFILIAVLLQNILLIPAILALGVSGIKLYKSVMKDKRKANLKIEVLRHTVFSCIMLCVLIISAIVKINVSGGMLETLIKYF